VEEEESKEDFHSSLKDTLINIPVPKNSLVHLMVCNGVQFLVFLNPLGQGKLI